MPLILTRNKLVSIAMQMERRNEELYGGYALTCVSNLPMSQMPGYSRLCHGFSSCFQGSHASCSRVFHGPFVLRFELRCISNPRSSPKEAVSEDSTATVSPV